MRSRTNVKLVLQAHRDMQSSPVEVLCELSVVVKMSSINIVKIPADDHSGGAKDMQADGHRNNGEKNNLQILLF